MPVFSEEVVKTMQAKRTHVFTYRTVSVKMRKDISAKSWYTLAYRGDYMIPKSGRLHLTRRKAEKHAMRQLRRLTK